MKRNIQSDEFGFLAEKGWNKLSERLDREMPAEKSRPKAFGWMTRAAIVAASLIIVSALGYFLKPTHSRVPMEPIRPIVNHITFQVESPDIVINRIMTPKSVVTPKFLSENKTSLQTFSKELSGDTQDDVTKKDASANPNVIGVGRQRVLRSTTFLATKSQEIDYEYVLSKEPVPGFIALDNKNLGRHAKLGFNLSSTSRGLLQSLGVGGGVSVAFPIGKKFSVEPGVGYDLTKYPEQKVDLIDEPIFGLARMVHATPNLNVKYRMRQSIELPLSIHYHPIKQIALTGGVDVGLLISQRMVFENSNLAYSGFDAYKNQLNQSEMNQLNRFNFGAHGGVSWFPTVNWKLGLYYGQNLTNERKIKEKKLKFSNHIFKVRMARYF